MTSADANHVRCLMAGTGQELSKIKLQLQEVIAGKSIAEDMNSALTVSVVNTTRILFETSSRIIVFEGNCFRHLDIVGKGKMCE